MIQIFIEDSDSTHDIFATVTDLNTAPPSIALNSGRVNRGARVAVNVQEDGNGSCLVTVHAVNADDQTNTKDFSNQSTQANGVIQVDVF
jgi:hypothetical protein